VLLILFTLHAGGEMERMATEAGFDAVISKSAPYPVVAIIEKMKATRLSTLEDEIASRDGSGVR
jgi:hypothetical protein